MRKYPEYKASGIIWIGEIPVNWEVWKVKFVANVKGRIGFRGYTVSDLVEEGEGALTLGATHINKNGQIDLSKPVFISWDKYYESPEIIVELNDILVVQRGSIGVVGIVNSNIGCATINPSLTILKKIKMDRNLLFFQLRSTIIKEAITTIVTETAVPMLSQNQISNFNILVPPISDQQSIVRFLDYKTGQIDRFIANRQKQIELLKEQKAGIINKAVTKGINPNAIMKDSGIEWIGEVPEHWEVIKLKFCLKSMVGGGTPSKDNPRYWNGDIPWVSPKDMKSDFIEKSEDYITAIGLKESSTILIKEPAILIVVRSGILKHTLPVSVNTVQVTLNQDLKALVPNSRFSIEYFFELFRGVAKVILLNCTKVVATVDSIDTDDLINFLVPVPSIDEQNEILIYINSETTIIDTLTSKYQKQIDLMQEYRTSLISQAVTGKIDVREWEPKREAV